MTTIKRFTPDYKMHAVRFEAFAREAEHGEYVRFDAHQQKVSALEAERDAQQKRADALAVENTALKDVLGNICCRDNEPEYHDCGMGCGLEDRGITDRYAAMAHGWELAMERIYEEVIPLIDDLPETPATDATLAAIQAQGVEKFAERMLTLANDPTYSTASHRNDLRDAGAKAMNYAAELREAK